MTILHERLTPHFKSADENGITVMTDDSWISIIFFSVQTHANYNLYEMRNSHTNSTLKHRITYMTLHDQPLVWSAQSRAISATLVTITNILTECHKTKHTGDDSSQSLRTFNTWQSLHPHPNYTVQHNRFRRLI